MDIQKREFVLIFLYLFFEDAFGSITDPKPENQAVLPGARVKFNCASDLGSNAVSWAFIKVNSFKQEVFSVGSNVLQNFSSLVEVQQPDMNQCNLIIKSATLQLAGTYICSDPGGGQGTSSQLIVVDSNPVSNSSISTGVRELYANQVVMISCSVSYMANSSYVNASMMWSSGSMPFDGLPVLNTTYGTLITATSTINVTVGYVTTFPVYQCQVTFNVSARTPDATNQPSYKYAVPPSYPSDVNVIYIKPQCIITGADAQNRVYTGGFLNCAADANPSVGRSNYTWTDHIYGNLTKDQTIQIWYDGEYTCTGQNAAGQCSGGINVTTYITTTASTTTAITTTRSASQTNATGVPAGGDKPTPQPSTGEDKKNVIIGVVVGVGGFILILVIIIVICCCIKKKKSGRYGEDRNMKSMADYPPPPYPAHAGPQRNSNPDVVDFQTPYANVVDDGLNYAQIQLDNQPRSRQPLKMPTESNYTDVRLA